MYLKAPMTRPVGVGGGDGRGDGRTRSEPVLGGGVGRSVSVGVRGGDDVVMRDVGERRRFGRAEEGGGRKIGIPLTPRTSTSASPIGEGVGREHDKINHESGPFIKSGGFFGKCEVYAVVL